MASPLKALRVLKLWQAGTLAAVLIGAAGATYGTYALLDGTGQSGLGENQQLIPVQLGDLVNQVSTNGSIIFPNRETLNFGTQGTVGDVLVEEGQHVEDGQELARLDETTVASLERAVAQARINLQDAQDALANAKDPHTPLDVAQAEANVANAKLSLQNAGDDLASLMEPASQDMAQADARVAESRLALGDAQDALDRLLTPTSQDLAQAEARVADARLALGDAQDALDRLLKPTSQDLAQAEARVADSRLALEDSRDALDRLLTPTSQDLAQVEARVADAKLALDNAEDALAGLLEPSSQQIAQVEVAVVNAGISVEDAQEALDAVRSGPNDEDITKAQGDVDSAATTLDIAAAELPLARREWDTKVETARDSFDTALEEYGNVFRKWLGIDPETLEEDVSFQSGEALDPDTLLGSWDIDLTSVFAPGNREPESRGFYGEGPPSDDPATLWSELVVYVWMNLHPVPVIGTCEDIALTPQDLCVKREIDDAWSALESATDNLGTVETQGARAFANAEVAVDRAEEALADAEQFLADLNAGADLLETESKAKQLGLALAGLQDAQEELARLTSQPDAVEVKAKQKQVAVARANLEKAEEDLETLRNEPDAAELEAKRKQVAVAQAGLEKAEEDLETLRNEPDAAEAEAKRKQVAVARAGLEKAEEDLETFMNEPDAAEVEAKRKQVAVAQANLEKAEEDLDTLRNEPDPVELEAKRKQVDVAQAGLEKAEGDLAELRGSVDALEVALREADIASAQLALDTALQLKDGAALLAPMAGTVSLVNVEAGQTINANTPIFEIVDSTVVEVDGIVDEIDVLFVQAGAPAEVTMDALPGQVLEGVVSSVALAAQTQQGVVSYPTRIQVQMPQGIQLVEGLSATASIVLREDRDVLLVPIQALYGTFDQPVVRVMINGSVEDRPVVLGNSDDFWVVVSEGLVQDEQVVMETTEGTTTQFSFRPGAFGGGGGFGGSFQRGGGGGQRQGQGR